MRELSNRQFFTILFTFGLIVWIVLQTIVGVVYADQTSELPAQSTQSTELAQPELPTPEPIVYRATVGVGVVMDLP